MRHNTRMRLVHRCTEDAISRRKAVGNWRLFYHTMPVDRTRYFTTFILYKRRGTGRRYLGSVVTDGTKIQVDSSLAKYVENMRSLWSTEISAVIHLSIQIPFPCTNNFLATAQFIECESYQVDTKKLTRFNSHSTPLWHW